jgi:uncharacterized membrane protein YfcA
MEYLIICLAAFLASGLTFFSGFGLGTILMPVIAIFFPVSIAISVTAVVHLFNNFFKLSLVGSKSDFRIVSLFGLPAVGASFLGAQFLTRISSFTPLFSYSLFGIYRELDLINLVIGGLIIFFLWLDLTELYKNISFPLKLMPLGGILTGFFGGLSGHQGAFRSMFLLNLNLSRESYISTGITIAVMVDVARLFVYSSNIRLISVDLNWPLMLAACLSAFAGAFMGFKLIKKITIKFIRTLVSWLLLVLALALIAGFV